MPPRDTDNYRVSFGVLSEHAAVREQGVLGGREYWCLISSHFIDNVRLTIGRARSYHRSYLAAHWAGPLAWNPFASAPAIRPELSRAIRNWHSINSRERLPGLIGPWISNWMAILRHWENNEFVPGWRLSRAGFGSFSGAAS